MTFQFLLIIIFNFIISLSVYARDRPHVFGNSPTNSTLKVFGTGLSKTATSSLASFFQSLGLQVIHYDQRLDVFLPHSTDFEWNGLYDNYDAVFDLPTAVYYDQLQVQYPQALFLSVFREPEEWFRSFENYLNIKQHYSSNFHPFFITELNKMVYGTAYPNHDIWIKNYRKHYQTMKTHIPSNKLLQLDMNSIRNSNTSHVNHKICSFLGINSNECIEFPIENTASQMNLAHIYFTLNDIEQLASPKKKFAYVTTIADARSFRNRDGFDIVTTSLVLCASIKQSYGSHSYEDVDFVIFLFGAYDVDMLLPLYACYDRIIPVKEYYAKKAPKDIEETRAQQTHRIQMLSLNLTYYHRVQFLEHNHVVVNSLDSFFFRSYYLSKTKASNEIKAPPELVTLGGLESPLDCRYMSIEPQIQDLVDIFFLYIRQSFRIQSGWMEYGLFDFEPQRYLMSISKPKNPYLSHRKFTLIFSLSFISLDVYDIEDIQVNLPSWSYHNWNYSNSWNTEGSLFYHYVLLKKTAMILHPNDFNCYVIHLEVSNLWKLFSYAIGEKTLEENYWFQMKSLSSVMASNQTNEEIDSFQTRVQVIDDFMKSSRKY